MPTTTAEPLRAVKTADGYLNVELVKVGTHDASTGKAKVTPELLASMVEAASHPQADRIPIKLGHSDSRFQDAEGNPPDDGDGNPAYGRVENLRLSEDGNTLIGDLVAMPQLLADVADSAYPDRSVEYFLGRKVGGKTFPAVLTGLALLGETAPAVKGLNDLYQKFAAQLAQPVVLHIVDDTPTIHHSAQIRPDGPPVRNTPSSGGTVAVSQAVRKALELADDATDDQIKEALAAQGIALLPDPAAPAAPAGSEPPAAAPPAAAEPPAPIAASANLPDGMVAVDAASLNLLSSRLEASETQLKAIRDAEDKSRRDGIVELASRTGKIAPTMVGHYRKLLDTDEANTAALLEASPVLFPVQEIGHGQIPAALSAAVPGEVDATKLSAAKNRFFPKGI